MKELELELLKVERLHLMESKEAIKAETEGLKQETKLAVLRVRRPELEERMMLGPAQVMDLEL